MITICHTSLAQNFSVYGRVVDSSETALSYATVAVLNKSDSVMVAFGVTNDDGVFQIKLEKDTTYLLKILLVGYTPIMDEFTVSESSLSYDYGSIILTNNQLLKTFDITAEGVPMLVNGDTIEYNAESFATDPNASMEELLKQLPGVEVDEDGNIKAQGEEVKKVYVDGKEFFGDDPKMATKNLPADAVKKVQVYDKKSKNSEFTGVDDGQKEKTINIELKDDKKAGVFGNITAGYGTDNLFKLKGSANKFNEKLQISVIGMGNNTSESGFSWSEYVSFMGGFDKMYGNGARRYSWSALPTGQSDGLITTYSGGLNLNYQPNKKLYIATNYFIYKADKLLDKKVYESNVLDSNSYVSFDTSREESEQWVHRLNFRLDYDLDSNHQITFALSGDLRTDYMNNELSYQSNNLFTDFINSGGRLNNYQGSGFATIGDLTFKNKFRKQGRSLILNIQGTTNTTDYNGDQNIFRGFISNTSQTFDTTTQSMQEMADNLGYEITLEHIEPLGKNRFLELEGVYGKNKDNNLYNVYDLLYTPVYDENFNTNLSTDFRKGYTHYSGEGNFRWIRSKMNISAGARFKQIQLAGSDFLRDTVISRDYFTTLPGVELEFRPRKHAGLRLSYSTDLDVPTIEQLQTKVDNSNPTRISTGNPALRPEYSHNVRLSGHKYTQFSETSIYGGINGSYINDMIQYSTIVNSQLISVTQPVNVDRNTRLSGYAGYGKNIRKLGGWLSLSLNASAGQGIFLLNGDQVNTNESSGNVSLSFNNSRKKKLRIRLQVSVGKSNRSYDSENLEDFEYRSLSGNLELTYKISEKWNYNLGYNHSQFNSSSANELTIIPLLKSSLSRYILKNERGEIKLEAFDILNQNRGFTQSAILNYYQETRTNSIGRYFMISFTYSLSKLDKQADFWFH